MYRAKYQYLENLSAIRMCGYSPPLANQIENHASDGSGWDRLLEQAFVLPLGPLTVRWLCIIYKYILCLISIAQTTSLMSLLLMIQAIILSRTLTNRFPIPNIILRSHLRAHNLPLKLSQRSQLTSNKQESH